MFRNDSQVSNPDGWPFTKTGNITRRLSLDGKTLILLLDIFHLNEHTYKAVGWKIPEFRRDSLASLTNFGVILPESSYNHLLSTLTLLASLRELHVISLL